jgi:hypothetical protein
MRYFSISWLHLLKEKASREEPTSLRGFTFKTLGVALFHGHLKKVRVVQKVNRVTELYGDQKKNRSFRERCLDLLFA